MAESCLRERANRAGWSAIDEAADEQRQTLLDRASAGSTEAHGALLNSYWQTMRRYFERRLSKRIAEKIGPDDLAQEACCCALAGFRSFAGTQLAVYRKWLMQICHNVLAAVLRRFAPGRSRDLSRETPLDRTLLEAAVQPSPDEILSAREDAGNVRRALDRLADEERQIVVWHVCHALKFTDIAPKLGRSADAVRRTFGRAVALLGNYQHSRRPT